VNTTTTRSRLGASLVLFGCLAASLSAQTTVVVPCAADNTLYEHPTGALSNGGGVGMFVGINGAGQKLRAVLRFDVAALVPAGASIYAAKLTIDSQQANDFSTRTLTGHRLLQAWGEGTVVAPMGGGFGGTAGPGDATWLHAMSPGTLWATVAGDFVATPTMVMSSVPVGLTSSDDGPETAADVQFWLDNPGQNFGWLIKSDETLPGPTARKFSTREATLGAKPQLTVSYLLAGQSGVWGTGCPTANGTLGLSFTGAINGGTTIQLNATSGPSNSGGAFYFDLSLYAKGGLLQPSCNVYLNPVSAFQGFLFPTDALGNGSVSWTLPTVFPNLFFATQVVAYDPGPFGAPFNIVLSNAGVAKIL
jgi:hypothetical protein